MFEHENKAFECSSGGHCHCRWGLVCSVHYLSTISIEIGSKKSQQFDNKCMSKEPNNKNLGPVFYVFLISFFLKFTFIVFYRSNDP